MYYMPEEVKKLRSQRIIEPATLRRSKVRFIDTEVFQCISFVVIILSLILTMYILAALN